MADMVNHPSHYNQNKLETIEIIQQALTPEEFVGFLKGNIIKYLDRHEFKNGEQDLEKAQWYSRSKINICPYYLEEHKNYEVDLYNNDFTNAVKHWKEYRNELSEGL